MSTRISLPSLIELCRVLRHSLDAGVLLEKVFRQQAERGPAEARALAGRIHAVLKRGHALEEALAAEQATLPPLFIELVRVGERTGNLPEVFAALEGYFRGQQQLWRQFVSRSLVPVLQLLAAILVVAGLIFALGQVADALLFLFGVCGFFALLGGVYFAVRRGRRRQEVEAFFLRLPVVGPCLDALALSRFCLAWQLTLETSLPLAETLRLSLRATGNAAFAGRAERAVASLRRGGDLAAAVQGCGLFSEEFQGIVAVAEETGQLPEVLRRQAKSYQELAAARLALATRLAGFGVWLGVALFIILAIFRIVAKLYPDLSQF